MHRHRHGAELPQRRVEAFGVQEDGGTTTIHFALDGDTAVLTVPTRMSPRPEAPSLEIGGAVLGVSEGARDPSEMAGKTYVCAGHPPPDEW